MMIRFGFIPNTFSCNNKAGDVPLLTISSQRSSQYVDKCGPLTWCLIQRMVSINSLANYGATLNPPRFSDKLNCVIIGLGPSSELHRGSPWIPAESGSPDLSGFASLPKTSLQSSSFIVSNLSGCVNAASGAKAPNSATSLRLRFSSPPTSNQSRRISSKSLQLRPPREDQPAQPITRWFATRGKLRGGKE